jgi:PAS domain S-box-containing protein
MREASRRARRLASALPWIAAGIGTVLLAGVAVLLGQDLERELAASATRARILAQGTAEAVSRRIEGIDFALTGLAARIDPARLNDPAHVAAVHAALVQARTMSRDTNAFVVLDRTGRLVATSRVPPEQTEHVSLADRPLFAPIAADPAPRLSISPPYLALLGNVKDRGIIALGRPLLDRDGGFSGVVTAILPTFDGRGLLPPIDLPDHVAVLLLRGDGVALEQRPAVSDLPREADRFGLPDALHGADPPPSGLFRAVRARDGETFLAAWHMADHARAIVLVGLSRSAVVAGWARTAVPVGLAGALLAAGLLLLAVRLSRAIVRLDDALADIAARERETSLIADTLGIGLWVRRGRQARTEYRGAFAERLTGKPREVLEGEPNAWRKYVVHPDDREGLKASYRGTDLTRGWRHEYRVIAADGSVRWVEDRAIQLPDASGDGPVYGAITDITESREARQRLARQERQIAAAVRLAGLAFWRLPVESDRFEWSSEGYRQFGVDPLAFEPRLDAVLAMIEPEDRLRVAETLRRVRETGESESYVYRFRRADGAPRVRWSLAGVERDESGRVVALAGVSQDITDRERMHAALTEQQRQLAEAGRIARIGFYRRDLESGAIDCTAEFLAQHGLPPGTPVDLEGLRRLVHPEDRPALDAIGQRVSEAGETVTFTYRIIRPDGALRRLRATLGLERGMHGAPAAVSGLFQDVTEEVEAREQIAEQARRLREVGRVAHIGFYRRALDGTQMVATEEKLRQFGLPLDSGPLDVGVFRALMHPDDVPRVEAAGRRIVETGESETVTFRVCRADGTVRWVRIVAGLERDAEGRKLAVAGLSQDVTEEIAAAEQLRQRDKLLADAGRVARLGFWGRRLDSEVITLTDEAYRQFGFEPGSVVPTDALIAERLHPDDLAVWNARRARLRETGEAQTVVVRVRHGDGVYRWIRNALGIERGSDGVAAVFGITQDVTEEVEARERLDRQRRQLAEAGRVAGLGFWRLPIGGEAFELSEAIYEQLGLDPRSFSASVESVLALMPAEDRAAMRATLERVAATGEQASVVYRIRRADGATRHRSSTVGLERASDGTPVALVGVSTDITERVEQEERLERAQRLNALGELTGGIAHDVNNLLSVIGLNLELVRELVPDGEARELTDAALHAVGQGAKLTRGLLAFAQRQSLRPAPVPLAPLIGGLDALLRRALGGRIVLRTDVAPDAPPALVDAAQLETSLVNLVLNARDAMPDGGQVTIRAARASPEEAATVGLAATAHVRISVEDEGVGMAPDVLARAFEPFFTTKGAGKGTGLGLAMVYGFARQSGGEVRIESSEGAGTTVTLWLPIAAEEDGAGEQRVADHAVLAGARLLVVEDEAPLRALVERLCREAGMEVSAVADADAALALLRYGVRVDLLLSDVRMPGPLDGHALAAEARALRRGLPVVLMTGFDDSRAGELVEPQLRKPFSRTELLDALAAALRVPQSAAAVT